MEHLGREPELVTDSTVHFGASKSDRDVKTADRTIPGFQARDVVYSAELSPGKLSVSIDGKPMIAMDRDLAINGVRPLQQPFNLIINLALGGAWAGPIDEAALPATMTIKAIRIWEWRLGQKKDEVTASSNEFAGDTIATKHHWIMDCAAVCTRTWRGSGRTRLVQAT